jgi:hypothetical protein
MLRGQWAKVSRSLFIRRSKMGRPAAENDCLGHFRLLFFLHLTPESVYCISLAVRSFAETGLMTMKRRGLLFCLVSGALFLCLSCLEIPEMSTLTDDVSNDFTILTYGVSASGVVAYAKKRQKAPKQRTGTQSPEPFPQQAAVLTIQPGSRDLLALHSLRRT